MAGGLAESRSTLPVDGEPIIIISCATGVGDELLEKPASQNTLSQWRKLAFAAGGFPMQLMQNIVAFFLPLFFLETVKLPPSYLSAIQLIARVSDALTDPIVGFLVLKTRTKLGRKRPW